MTETIHCTRCATVLPVQARFCLSCGEEVATPAARSSPPALPAQPPPPQPSGVAALARKVPPAVIAFGALLAVAGISDLFAGREEPPASPAKEPPPPRPCAGTPDEYAVLFKCEELIRDQLVAPATAKFPRLSALPPENSTLHVDPGDEHHCSRMIFTYVDSQNAFGAMLRQHYACTYLHATRQVVALPAESADIAMLKAVFRPENSR